MMEMDLLFLCRFMVGWLVWRRANEVSDYTYPVD